MLDLINLIFAFTLIIYFLLTVYYTVGFIKLKRFNYFTDSTENNEDIKISLIIPFKNEAKNLENLINTLLKQTLEDKFFEIIFVNDHSADNSEEIVINSLKDKKNFKLISLQKNINGKKEALKMGINNASYNIIVTTDADCILPENWLKTFYGYYKKYKPKLLIAPVIMKGSNFFENLQATEFFSLTAATAGACGIKRPIMSNGANLSFQKDIFFEFEDALNEKEISGDDIFLLHKIKKKYSGEIKYLKSNEAVVITGAEKNIKDFFRQRIRWTSKSKSYKDTDTILTAIIVFTANISLIISLIISLLTSNYKTLIYLSVLKFIPDLILFIIASLFFKQTKLLKYFPVVFPVYPFYILFTVVFAFFKRKVDWK